MLNIFNLKSRLLKRCFFTSLLILLALATVVLLREVQLSRWFELREIHVNPPTVYVDKTQLRQTTQGLLGQSLVTVDLEHLKNILQSIPWVQEVTLRRVWPHQLLIHFREQQPTARLNNLYLLNEQGEPFEAPRETWPEQLPELEAEPADAAQTLALYQQLNQTAQQHHLEIAWLQLTSRQSLALRLNNGITILIGQYDHQRKFDQLMQVYPSLAASEPKEGALETIDLRYPNGFAITRSNPTQP